MPEVIAQNLPFLLEGLVTTFALAAIGIAGGTVLGVLLGSIRHARLPVASALATAYIELLRGIPLLVVLFICYFALPALLGYRSSAFGAAALGFVLFIAAYLAEDFRSGLRSVRASQIQAGLASGLTPLQAFQLIVLPQAVRRAIPTFFNQYVRLFKFTSVASVIGVREVTGSSLLVNAREFQPIVILATVALTYLVICSALSMIGRLLYAQLAVRT